MSIPYVVATHPMSCSAASEPHSSVVLMASVSSRSSGQDLAPQAALQDLLCSLAIAKCPQPPGAPPPCQGPTWPHHPTTCFSHDAKEELATKHIWGPQGTQALDQSSAGPGMERSSQGLECAFHAVSI
jgi:hypothetical protein